MALSQPRPTEIESLRVRPGIYFKSFPGDSYISHFRQVSKLMFEKN